MLTTQLTDELFMLRLGRYQAYLWLDDDSTSLIDTGAPGSSSAIADALRTVGRLPAHLDRVVLTHFHDDHAGSARELSDWENVEVIAHETDAPYVRGTKPGPPPNLSEFERGLHAEVADGLAPAPPSPVHVEVGDGDELPMGGGARVIAVPGHTEGSIALYLPRHQVLFTGDTVAEHQGKVIPGVFNLDLDLLHHSMRGLADLDTEVACFGHGAPVTTEAAAVLASATRDLSVAKGRSGT